MMKTFLVKYKRILIAFFLIVIPLLIFYQNLDNQFVWDDEFILAHSDYLDEISTETIAHCWERPYNELYVPVSLTAYLFINQLSGVEQSLDPTIFHGANLLFHLFNGLLLFMILGTLTKNDWCAGAGALLYLIHPVQVEVVAFAWGFKDILSVFFALCAILCYLKYIQIRRSISRWIFYGFATLVFVLSMLSKPSTIVLPVIIFLIDYSFFNRQWKTAIISISPWILLTIPVFVITKLAQPYSYIEYIPPIWARPLIFFDAINFYLLKLIMPVKLSVAYGRTPQFVMSHWWFYIGWINPILIGYVGWKYRKKVPFLWISFVIFIVGLLPVSGLIPFEYQNWSTVADRYLYLSMIGASIALSALLNRWKKSWFILIPLVVFWIAMSSVQASQWQNKITLWSDAIQEYPDRIPMPYNNRGIAYADAGTYTQAFDDFEQAIAIDPHFEPAYYNRGETYFQLEKYQQALDDFNRAIFIDSTYVKAYVSRGNVYNEMDQFQKALSDYNRAIELKPDYADAYYHRGYIYHQLGELQKAFNDYNSAIKFDPFHKKAYNNRGTIFRGQRLYKKAIRDFSQAIAIDSSYLPAYNNRANTYALVGNYSLAISDYNRILDINPNYASAYRDRAVSYFYLKRYQKAWSDVQKAQALGIEVNPDFLKALERKLGNFN